MYLQTSTQGSRGRGSFRALGYPTEKEDINLAVDGSLLNYSKYHRWYTQVLWRTRYKNGSTKGKTTKSHPRSSGMSDQGSKEQITDQRVEMDVMHAAGERFLVCVCSPLELTMKLHV